MLSSTVETAGLAGGLCNPSWSRLSLVLLLPVQTPSPDRSGFGTSPGGS